MDAITSLLVGKKLAERVGRGETAVRKSHTGD